MEGSSSNNWSYSDTTRAGRPCRIYTELNGQFETEDMEAFGHGRFQFVKKRVQANAIQVGCSNEKKGCKVRALVSLNGKFLRYLGEPHGLPIHNHCPFYGSLRTQCPKASPEKCQPTPPIMIRIGENRHGYQFYRCPKGYVFFVNGITKLRTNVVEFEMSCAERRDGCRARITCNSEDLLISRERGDHNHVQISEEALRSRDFEIHYGGNRLDGNESPHNEHQSQVEDGSSEETDTDSSESGNLIGERTPYCSEIIGPEDDSHDFWADPVAVCTDHNYTIDPRSRREKKSIACHVDRKHQEVVVVSADSFHEFLDHGYVPDADVVVEIPFDDGDGQVLSDAFGAHRLRTQVRNEPNKIYVPRAGRM